MIVLRASIAIAFLSLATSSTAFAQSAGPAPGYGASGQPAGVYGSVGSPHGYFEPNPRTEREWEYQRRTLQERVESAEYQLEVERESGDAMAAARVEDELAARRVA